MEGIPDDIPAKPNGDKDLHVLADISRFHAKHRPQHTAMVFGQRRTSYAQLDAHANQTANGLIGNHSHAQQRVAWLGLNSDHFFEVLLGCAKANMVMCPISWRLAAPEIENILADAEAEILFVDAPFFEIVKAVKNSIPTLIKIVALGEEHPGWESYEKWRNRQSCVDPNCSISEQDTAVQLYTSGTTGLPKGVLISNAALMASSVDDRDDVDWNVWSADEISLQVMPCFHIGGLRWGLMGLIPGCTTVILADFEPSAVLNCLEGSRITKVFLVPAAMRMILSRPESQNTDYSSIRHMLYGASPIPVDLLKQALAVFKCGLVQLYGLTEAGGQATYLPPKDHHDVHHQRLQSAGKPLPYIEIRIEDEEGHVLPAGQIGEICIKTPSRMTGYWKLTEETDKVIRQGWIHSGDAGYMDEDGYVYVHDRIKDMIVSGGENIYPAEVENAVFGHPAIADVAVIGVPDEQWGEAVKAVVVLRDGASATAHDVIAHARQRIAAYKAPKSVDFVEQLPRNAAGKFLKREIRKPYWKGHDRMVN